jgi:hypothetical protein
MADVSTKQRHESTCANHHKQEVRLDTNPLEYNKYYKGNSASHKQYTRQVIHMIQMDGEVADWLQNLERVN